MECFSGWSTVFEAEKASRGAKRTLLIHDRLLNGSENQKIAELTGRQLKDVKAAYNKAVSPELRHHTHQGKMPLSGTKLGSICEQLWAYLSELTDGDQNLKAIDTLRSEFENHLRIIPREFYGAFTTGPQMPPHDVLPFWSLSAERVRRQEATARWSGFRVRTSSLNSKE